MKNKYYAIFGILFLLLSLGGALFLIKQNVDTRNQAAPKRRSDYTSYDDCRKDSGKKTCDGFFPEHVDPPKKPGQEEIVTDGSCPFRCTPKSGPAFCISGATKTCDQVILETLGEYPQRGGTYSTSNTDGIHIYKCGCSGGTYYFDKPGVCNFSGGKATSVTEIGGDTYKDYQGTDNDGLCHIIDFTPTGASLPGGTKSGFWCPGKFDGLGSGCQQQKIPANFNYNCFCGTIQIDTAGQGFTEKTMKCGCAKTNTPDTPNDTPVPTPTRIPTTTRTPTPTFVIVTDTPAPTPTGTLTPTNTPIITLTPTNTPIPTSTPVPAYLGCGYTPCDNGGKQCTSGLVCITANNSSQYCSLPQYTSTCATNPGYTGCCTAPVAQGPSPTRIILPTAGFNFPSQALTIIGGIATLLGFLILL